MKGHFSEQLINEITTTLELGEQVILFQNRRGYFATAKSVAAAIDALDKDEQEEVSNG